MLEELTRAGGDIRFRLDAPTWALSDGELIETLDEVHGLEQRLAAAKLALIREVDGRGVAVKQGATSTAVWLRERLHLSIQAGQRLVTLAAALDSGPPVIREALAAGAVTVEQASVIGKAVAALPSEAGAATVAEAAELLVSLAGRLEPTAVRIAGERILLHVAPTWRRKPTGGRRNATPNRPSRNATSPGPSAPTGSYTPQPLPPALLMSHLLAGRLLISHLPAGHGGAPGRLHG